MKVGSLFDGSGGFPLAAALCGGTPVWASEIEPYPIAVTRNRFPRMKHLGSVTRVNGAEVEPVDVITFGSPCQDLSVAGKRAGLKHEDNGDEVTTRSGLFMEAVRIIKEMREATNGKYPRFALWENVPGAFSSNKGEDFRTVLEEIIKIIEPTAVMPKVPAKGWPYADSYSGDGWSIAYRVLDAQYWGVPQRRRRIYLVADFGGQCARKILFEREGLRGDFEKSRPQGQGTSTDSQDSVGADDRKRNCVIHEPGIAIVDSIGGNAERGWEGDISPTLKATHYKFPPCVSVPSAGFCTEHSAQSRGVGYEEETSPTLRAGVVPGVVYGVENHPADSRVNIDESGTVQTLTGRMGTGGGNVPMVMEATLASGKDVAGCLTASGYDKLGAQEMFSGDYTVVEKHSVGDIDEVIDAQLEVRVRRHPVDVEGLQTVLREAKQKSGLSNTVIADALNQPVTMVEHWFRTDNGFAIPSEGLWFDLKALLRIETDEFDASITEFDWVEGKYDMANRIYYAEVSPTLTTQSSDYKYLLPVPYTLKIRSGVSVDSSGKPAGKGPLVQENKSATLAASQDQYLFQPVTCLETFHCTTEENISQPLKARDYKDPLCVAIDRETFNCGQNFSRNLGIKEDGVNPTLVARGPSAVAYWDGSQVCGTLTANNAGGNQRMPDKDNFNCVVSKYIVRRLTPTECARLQGFADGWSHIEKKKKLTDEEYEFWLNVRNENAAINGKATKEYTKAQMLKWYNGLWTDSAEYKLWGNGIALPCALYVMQGIRDAL